MSEPTSNLFQCLHCGFFVIAEEVDTHECKKIKEYKIVDGILWATDGQRWYPIKLSSPTRNQHDFKHQDDSTEPIILILSAGNSKSLSSCPIAAVFT